MEHSAPRSPSLSALRLQSSSGPQAAVRALFLQAGIAFDGSQSFDIEVRNPRVFSAIASGGSLGFGESYMAGDWECAQLDEMASRLLAARLDQQPIGVAQLKLFAHRLRSRLINLQSPARAYQVGEQHYDIVCRLIKRKCAAWCLLALSLRVSQSLRRICLAIGPRGIW